MPSFAPPSTFHGYHFHIRFFPKWAALAPLLVQRARAVGLTVPDDGAGLEPRATSLAFVGTRWTRFKHGGLRFDVLEERRDLKGEIVSSAGNAGEHPTYAFGLARPGALRGPHGAERARRSRWPSASGSTPVRSRSARARTAGLGEEVIAEFKVWTALEALARVALGEPALGRPSSGTALVTKHTSPLWAPSIRDDDRPPRGRGARALLGRRDERDGAGRRDPRMPEPERHSAAAVPLFAWSFFTTSA